MEEKKKKKTQNMREEDRQRILERRRRERARQRKRKAMMMRAAVAGGLVFSQVVTLYITPVYYVYLDHFGDWVLRTIRRIFHRTAPQTASSEN